VKRSILEGVFAQPGNGLLVSRVAIFFDGGLGLPIDLMPILLTIDPKFTSTDGEHAILDNDRNEPARFDFDVEQIREKFVSLKLDLSNAFYEALTDHAIEQWK
jgi:hypothetical protein